MGTLDFLEYRADNSHAQSITNNPTGTGSDEGLYVSLPGLSFGLWRRRFRPRVFLRVNSNTWYSLSSDMDSIVGPSDSDNVHLAFILQQLDWSSFDDLPSNEAVGVLVIAMRSSYVGSDEAVCA